jgi:hypothetical protein
MRSETHGLLVARWPNRDPIGEEGGTNLMAFVANDPIGWSDTLGQTKGGRQNISVNDGGRILTRKSPERVVLDALKRAKSAGMAKHAAKLRGLLKVIRRGGGLSLIILDVVDEAAASLEGVWVEVGYDENGCPLPDGRTRRVWLPATDPDGRAPMA